MKTTIAKDLLMETIIQAVYKNSVPEHYLPLIVKTMVDKEIDNQEIAHKLHQPLGRIADGLNEYFRLEKLVKDSYDDNRDGYMLIKYQAAISVDGDVDDTSILIERKLVNNYLKLNL